MIYLPLAREIDQIVTFFSANQISPFFFIMRYIILYLDSIANTISIMYGANTTSNVLSEISIEIDII